MADNVNIIDLLKELARTKGASDLIITVGKPPQLRVNNELAAMNYEALLPKDTEQLCFSVLNEEQAQRFRAEKEIDLSMLVAGSGRYRINMFQQRSWYAMAARIVLEQVPAFEALLLPDIIHKFAMLPRGLVLITGPVGSGKSTTVASMVDYINEHRRCHIISIEDPIEFVHNHKMATVDQREVGSDTHSFNEALRRVMRQSPDVVVIGEIRDRISAQAAVTLAETGHLTLATLHTRGSIGCVNRLVDMFPAEQNAQIKNQLSAALAGVIWQQLLPKKPDGLVVACEIMVVVPAIRALIRQGRTHEIFSILQAGKKYGMCTMEQAIEGLMERDLLDSETLAGTGVELSTVTA
jgi:twitching motility protein PilT